MVQTRGSALRPLARALTDEHAEPVLLFVEGAAGEGKSHLLQALADLPATAHTARVRWRCGAGTGPPGEDGPRRAPTLWLVDDVHRAGEDELRRLRRVLGGLEPGSAAAVAYRPEELPVPGLPLGGPPVTYPSRLTVLRHRLAPWDEERVHRAASEALGGSCTAEAARRLHELTGGVPRVVVDLLAVLRERQPPFTGTAAEVEAAGVPTRLAELVLSRTHTLPPEHRPVVWAAAVLGAPAPRDELIAVSGLGAAAGTGALLRALEAAALAEPAEGRYGFAVPLAAPAVRASVPGPVRQDLHARAAAVLRGRQPVPWADVAEHHRAAGETRKWLGAVEKAAGAAAAAGRHQQAVTLLERTLATPGLPPRSRARLAPLLARSAVTGLRSDQTVDVLAQIVRDASLPPAVRGELRLDLGLMLANQMGRGPEGRQVLETAAAELCEVRPVLAARAMAALSSTFVPGDHIEAAREWMAKAVALADAGGDEAMRTAVLANHADLALSCADPGAWELVRELSGKDTDPACARQAARGLCNAANSAVWLGFHDRAEALLAEGLDLAARSGAPYQEHTALGARLLQEWWTGQWTGLAERCEDFVAATADMPFLASDAYVVRGMLALAQGDWGEAGPWLSQRGTTRPENLPVPLAATAAGAAIRLALARQEVEAAAERARAAWTALAEKGVWTWGPELLPWAVEAVARAGDTTAAHTMVRTFSEGVGRRDAPAAQAALIWGRAVLTETEAPAGEERDRDRLLRAARLYQEAAAAYEVMPHPYSRALTAEGAARCVLVAAEADAGPGDEGGDTAAPPSILSAVAELETCARNFTELGAVWDAARVRALLRTQRPVKKGRPPGRPSHADELSPREAEVAQLAATGLTNREIAATLHLSPRTVEQHIARAMRKTGALSRRDLAHRLSTTNPPSALDGPDPGPPPARTRQWAEDHASCGPP
ncbi:helix-turn-helix transcriptional regulator [Streptomyces drozdowiczii]|uniref:helix-turn-helix transcriptional regulator n=1 Tax=Streptomyces drozdowiczii TaxID=202862 RepID=UPI00224642F0|nr:LuxR C-terminal-related transcriptional regulator [Streptomyces drozdowiczii]MCX0243530.1 LuxR C-terminal-related transcriptional regulator [Streptomyces drozdowiczii]